MYGVVKQRFNGVAWRRLEPRKRWWWVDGNMENDRGRWVVMIKALVVMEERER